MADWLRKVKQKMLERISAPIKQKQQDYQLISTDINKSLTQLVSTGTSKGYFWNDKLCDELNDLVNPQFRGWYCGVFYKLGRDRVLELAGEARREGRNTAKRFSQLLKNATVPN